MKDFTESEKWLMEQARAGLLVSRTPSGEIGEEIYKFVKCLWPFMEPYLSALHPTFSFNIGSAGAFASENLWLLRDGAIPLAWFFECASEEMPESSRILVHASLSPLVPKHWRRQTEYYDLYAADYFNLDHPPEKLFLTAPVHQMITSLEELDEILDQTMALIDLSKLKEVILYCPVRTIEMANSEEESFDFQYYNRILRRFGDRVRFLHWNIIQQTNFVGTAVVDLNAGWIFKDNSVVHLALSRGGGLLRKPRPQKAGQTRFALSRYHGIDVMPSAGRGEYQLAKNAEELLSFYTSLHKSANSPRSRLPWPKWFQGFSRAAYKRQPNLTS